MNFSRFCAQEWKNLISIKIQMFAFKVKVKEIIWCSIRGVKRTLDRIYMRRHTKLRGVGRKTFKFNQVVFFFCLGIFQIEGGGCPMQCSKKGCFFWGFFHSQPGKSKFNRICFNKIKPTTFLPHDCNQPTDQPGNIEPSAILNVRN